MTLKVLKRLRARHLARVEARREADRMRLGAEAGDAARRQFRWAEAEAAYRAYLSHRPRDAGVIARLARTLAAAGRRKEARSVLLEALRGLPRSSALARAQAELEATPSPLSWDELREGARPEAPLSAIAGGLSLRLSDGAVARPEAEAWLAHALAMTGARVAYADHELSPARPGDAWTPVFQPAPHPLELETTPCPPVIALFARGMAPEAGVNLRGVLIEAAERGEAVHVPLVLAEVDAVSASTPTMVRMASVAPRLRVVVPTRDRGGVLEVMVESLKANAARPDLISIVVVDNGSRDPDTLDLLARWRRGGVAEVLRIDEPFNWSDLNNRAAAGGDEEVLLFVNNDMKMRTEGWDARLAEHLALPGVGVVGARLIYPAGNLQHAGMALGVRPSQAVSAGQLHEGLGAAGDVAGPLDRWARRRPAAAVTGAFLAVPRKVFRQAGGFDAATFPIGGNDVDFCLRVRALGLTVLYAGDIELSHDESLSRGHDDDPVKQARAEAERAGLVRIWGEDALFDPSRSPAWVADGVRLFAGRRVPDAETVEAWIRRSPDAWRTRRADQGAVTPRRR